MNRKRQICGLIFLILLLCIATIGNCDPPIPANWDKCIVTIEEKHFIPSKEDITKIDTTSRIVGTGFLVGGGKWSILVSAGHVMDMIFNCPNLKPENVYFRTHRKKVIGQNYFVEKSLASLIEQQPGEIYPIFHKDYLNKGRFDAKGDFDPSLEHGIDVACMLYPRTLEEDVAYLTDNLEAKDGEIVPGEEIFLAGYPFGWEGLEGRPIITGGFVSMNVVNGRYLADIKANPGNSGSPVFFLERLQDRNKVSNVHFEGIGNILFYPWKYIVRRSKLVGVAVAITPGGYTLVCSTERIQELFKQDEFIKLNKLLIRKTPEEAKSILKKMNIKYNEASFFDCAKNGDTDSIVLFLYSGMDPNRKDNHNNDCSALMYAAMKGHTEIVRVLLDKSVEIDAKNKIGYTALMYASENGHTKTVQALLENGAEVNTTTITGTTPLITAAGNGHTEILQILVSKGSEVNAKTTTGSTALIAAAKGGYSNIIQVLLAKGADVNIKDNEGNTALSLATENHFDTIIEMLKKAGEKE